jgi:hypothetical protein
MNLLLSWMALAAAESAGTVRSLEFDVPEAAWQWAAIAVGSIVLLTIVIGLYFRDTAALPARWTICLTALRLGVLGVLLWVALNPQERTQRMSFRPSRVAVLADTSLSMRYPAESATSADSAQSRAAAVDEVLAKSPLIEKLRERHEVSIYTFDTALAGPQHVFPPQTRDNTIERNSPPQSEADAVPLDWTETLRPRGTETRLGESLVELMRQAGGSTLSGIVIFSDGGSNAGVDVSTAHEAARRADVRLVTVGVGSTEPPVNVQVVNIQSPSDVQIGDPYELSAFVQGQGLAGKSVDVELLERPDDDPDSVPTLVEQRTVQMLEDGVPAEVRFKRTPSIAGTVEYLVRVKSTERELTEDDNERRKSVNVLDRELRVLIVAGGPLREYQFVRNLLHRHGAIELDVWLQTVDAASYSAVSQEAKRLLLQFPATAADLYEYDVILAFDPDWRKIPSEGWAILNQWVAQHGGGLIVIASDVYTPELAAAGPELEAIRDLYPVFLSTYQIQLDSQSEQAWPVELTPEGKEAGFLALAAESGGGADVWGEFAGVYRCYPTLGPKAGATVYAHFSDPRQETEYGLPVLLAAQFYGSGRTFYLGSPEMWRLRSIDEAYYDRFWTKVVREVGQGRLRRGTSRGMLLLERNQYVLGQTVRIRANLLDPQLEPVTIASVPIDIYDPQGRPLLPQPQLVRDEGRVGQYVGDFRANMPGSYLVKIRIPGSAEGPEPGSSDELSAKIDVVLPNLEADNPRQNAKLLADLARDTGGAYLSVSGAAREIPALLPDRSEQFLLDETLRTLWDRQWVLYLLVGLLSVEWLTRKLLKLA